MVQKIIQAMITNIYFLMSTFSINDPSRHIQINKHFTTVHVGQKSDILNYVINEKFELINAEKKIDQAINFFKSQNLNQFHWWFFFKIKIPNLVKSWKKKDSNFKIHIMECT